MESLDLPIHFDDAAENPRAVKQMGEAFLQSIIEYWQTTGTARIHPGDTPDGLTSLREEGLPLAGLSLERILADISSLVMPGLTRVASPRYLGMMNPSPALVAVFAESLAAAFNQNCSLWHQSPAGSELEKTVIRWLSEVCGMRQPDSFGILLSGGSAANITALKLARDHAAGPAVSRQGLAGSAPLCVYISEEGHYSFDKGMDICGMGTARLRRIPAGPDFRVRPALLREQIERDIRDGFRPAAIAGIAGTTNSGTVDPLDELAELAAEFRLWFHVDAAYGGAAACLPEKAALFKGLARADSITIDPHKWFFIPFEAGALLVRERQTLHAAFAYQPAYYLEQGESGLGRVNFFEYGPQGSRSFKALKIWCAFRYFGMEHYRAILRRNTGFARHLHARLAVSPDFETLHEPDLGIVCYRARPAGWAGTPREQTASLNRLNRALHRRIEEKGEYWISITRLTGDRVVLRTNFQNYRTRQEHVDGLYRHLHDVLREVLAHEE